MMTRTANQLILDLTNAAISYGDGLESGDSKKANKANGAAMKAFDALRAQGEEERILQLLEFAHPSVRLMAASMGMRFNSQRAEPVLQNLAKGPKGSVCTMATSFLQFWKDKTPGVYQPLKATG